MRAVHGKGKHLHDARVRWLTVHPDWWAGVPGADEDMTEMGSLRLAALQGEMKKAGLFGASAARQSQRDTIRRLVSALRGHREVPGSWGE